MLFAHDTEVSLQAAVVLVNSAEEPDTLVCSCRVVSRAEIVATGLKTVEAVGERTGAGTGCGGCRPDIAALI